MKPTAKQIDDAGDALLEALLRSVFVIVAERDMTPVQGDLVVETSSFSLDWERVGYLLEPLPSDEEKPIVIWSVGGRVTRWTNASVCRVGRAGTRLPSFPYPTPEQIEASS